MAKFCNVLFVLVILSFSSLSSHCLLLGPKKSATNISNQCKRNGIYNNIDLGRLKARGRLHSSLWAAIDCQPGEFESLVVKSQVPVVVDFFANWCGPCKLVAPIFEKVSGDFSPEAVKFVKVDTDVHDEAISKYNIQGLPLFAVIVEGKVVSTHSGALSAVPLKEFVLKGLQKGNVQI